jgi:hypothetical protein
VQHGTGAKKNVGERRDGLEDQGRCLKPESRGGSEMFYLYSTFFFEFKAVAGILNDPKLSYATIGTGQEACHLAMGHLLRWMLLITRCVFLS